MREGETTRGEGQNTDSQRWVRGWRQVVLATGMFIYPILAASGVAQYSAGTSAVVGYGIVLAFCCVGVFTAPAIRQDSPRRFWWLIGALTLLFLAVLPLAHAEGFYLCTVIASVVAVRLKGRATPIVAGVAIATFFVPWAVPSWHTGPGWTQTVAFVFTVLTFYAFSEIARSNNALVEARAEVARLASEAERNRIARDLHDLVGHSLTAITVKSNLARQLAEAEDSPALREITEVENLSRQALADMRAAVTGYREVTLAGELARARELLRAAGVTADLPTATEVVNAAGQELFGWVVREGVTNVVRHARATRCTVEVSPTTIEIRDDGVGTQTAWGNGLAGLAERVAAIHGEVVAEGIQPHGWRLRVTVPAGADIPA